MDSGILLAEVFRVSHRFRKNHLLEVFSDLPRGEFFALNMLWEHRREHPEAEGMYVSELAQVLQSSPPAVSRGLKALEQKGYIERHVDPADRRNTYIRVTPQGEATCKRVKQQVAAYAQHIFQCMGEADMRKLIDLWNRLMDIMETETDKLDKGEHACSKS